MPNPNPIPKTENLTPWPEGVSGNPAGRPRGSLGDRLRALLAVETEDGKTVGDKFLEAAIEASKKGDFRFFKEIFDRHDGPIAETAGASIDVSKMSDEDLDAAAEGKS